MSFKGLFLKKNANFLVPADYSRMLLAKFPSFVTIVTAEKNKLIVDGQETPDFETFAGIQEIIKADDALMYFANYPAEFPEDSAQPFVLDGEREEPNLICMLAGEFGNYADEKSSHSPEFFAFAKYFRPKVKKWLKNGKLSDVKEELNDASTKADIRNSFQGKGSVAFMFPSGDIFLTQNKNPDFKEYPWGWTTDSLGYVQKAEDAPTAEVKKEEEPAKKKSGWFSSSYRKEKKQEGTAAVAGGTFPGKTGSSEPEVTYDTDGEAGAIPPAKEDVVASAKAEKSDYNVKVLWKPAISVGMTKAQKQAVYDGAFGIDLWRKKFSNGKHYPDNFKNGAHIAMEVPQSKLAEYAMKGWSLAEGSGRVTASTKPKEETKPAAGESSKATHDAGYKEFGNTEARSEQKAVDKFKKTVEELHSRKVLDFSSASVFDPTKIQSMENEWEPMWKRIGMDGPEGTYAWSRPALKSLMVASPEAFLDMMEDWRMQAIKALPKGERPATPKPSDVKPQKEEEVKPETPPAGKKGKSLYGYRRAA